MAMLNRLFRRHPDADDPIVDAFANVMDDWQNAVLLPPPSLVEMERRESEKNLDDLRGRELRLEKQIADFQEELANVRRCLNAEGLKAAALVDDPATVDAEPANVTKIRKRQAAE